MTAALYVVWSLSAIVFLVASGVRAVGYARLPLHLRWELYPVPRETAARAAHGGSHFETADWWTRPAHVNRVGELKAVIGEILFLKALREFNRGLWWRSFPFHFGLYLLFAAAALIAAAAVTTLTAPAVFSVVGPAIRMAYRAIGAAGFALALVGAAGLLQRRLTDPELRRYTTPGDIFNLAAFIVALALLAAGLAVREPGAPGPTTVVAGILAWDTSVPVPPLLAVGLGAAALLAAYVPCTHMSHFIGKYFTYHAVRWDDAVNRPGGAMQRRLAAYLTYRPTWSAPHVRADGERTWEDIVTLDPSEKDRR
jgi:nitrate reductase gamma subunit